MIAGVRAGDIINGYEVCSWVLLFIVRGEGRAISHLCFTSPVLLLFVLYASDHCRFLPVAKATETCDSQTYMSSTRVGVCAFELAPKKRRQRSGGGASLHETAAEYILRSIRSTRYAVYEQQRHYLERPPRDELQNQSQTGGQQQQKLIESTIMVLKRRRLLSFSKHA